MWRVLNLYIIKGWSPIDRAGEVGESVLRVRLSVCTGLVELEPAVARLAADYAASLAQIIRVQPVEETSFPQDW